MKKIYNQPESLVVALSTAHGMCQMMTQSLTISNNEEINDPDDILTKEDISVGKSIWDNEW